VGFAGFFPKEPTGTIYQVPIDQDIQNEHEKKKNRRNLRSQVVESLCQPKDDSQCTVSVCTDSRFYDE
jgi:hypothetical protein